MNQQKLAHFKKLLIDEKKEVEAELKSMDEHGPNGSLLEWTDELSSYDNHPGDIASETFEMEKHMALNTQEEKLLRDIDDCLHKIEDGAYGICETCGKEINSDRLEAIPYAKECINCAKENQISPDRLDKDRPNEEDVMEPSFGQSFPDEDEGELNQGTEIWRQLESYGSADNMQDINPNRVKDYRQINALYDETVDETDEADTLSNADLRKSLD